MLHVGHDVITAIRPNVIASPAEIDSYVERMLSDTMTMVEAEAERRATTRQLPK